MVWSEIIANVRQYHVIEVIVKPIEQAAESNVSLINRPVKQIFSTTRLIGEPSYYSHLPTKWQEGVRCRSIQLRGTISQISKLSFT